MICFFKNLKRIWTLFSFSSFIMNIIYIFLSLAINNSFFPVCILLTMGVFVFSCLNTHKMCIIKVTTFLALIKQIISSDAGQRSRKKFAPDSILLFSQGQRGRISAHLPHPHPPNLPAGLHKV